MSTRRDLLAAACALPWAGPGFAQGADDRYPDKPVRFIVPYTAGSVGDLFVRHLSELLRRRLGAVFVIDNRPGASQSIGADAVAKSPADGYTVFLGSQSGLVLNTLARKKLPYDPLKDFAPISMLFNAPMYLFVNPKVQANRVQELIAVAKANPGKLTFASIGPGTSSHLAGEMLKSMAGIDMLHVPYRGGPEATTALISGEVDVMFNGGNVLPQLTRGKVRAIGIGSSHRLASMPELPTLKESGLPDFDVSPWFAMFAPAGTPRPIVQRLNKEVVAALKEPAIRERAVSLSLEIEPSTAEQLGARLRDDFPVWEKTMRLAGIQPE
jgi:tripartite-type tricarboxylate transporter receptor subunit TctC